jgi:hypothetical protein
MSLDSGLSLALTFILAPVGADGVREKSSLFQSTYFYEDA